MDTANVSLDKHGVDTIFAVDKHTPTPYCSGVGATVKSVDGGAPMTQYIPDWIKTVAAGFGTGTVALIGWVVRLHARVSVIESKQEDFGEWLTRVETKLDRVIEGRPHR